MALTNKKAENVTEGPTLIDLFCGAGGMTIGFKKAGFRPVFAIDADRHAVDTYRLNFGDHVTCGDIRQVESFPEADVVIGGPPCQGFSRLGKQTHGRPTDKSYEGNGLWEEYMRCVEQTPFTPSSRGPTETESTRRSRPTMSSMKLSTSTRPESATR